MTLRAEDWKSFVSRALREENLGYTVDTQCGVHYFVDEEFERGRSATLAILQHTDYVAVRAAYDDAFRHIDADPPDTKASVRSLFESVEILVRRMIDTRNLNKWSVENTLKERCLVLYKDDFVASKVIVELFNSFTRGSPSKLEATPPMIIPRLRDFFNSLQSAWRAGTRDDMESGSTVRDLLDGATAVEPLFRLFV